MTRRIMLFVFVQLLLVPSFSKALSIAEPDPLFTPLHAAAMRCDYASAVDLVEKGASVDATSSSKVTPLMLAAGSGCLDIVKLIVEKGAGLSAPPTPLISAIYGLGSGYPLSRTDDFIAIIDFLLERGVDFNARANGKTALTIALELKQFKVIDLIVKSGAKIEIEGLEWAASENNYQKTLSTVVSDEASWTALWKEAFGAPAPQVDFSKFFIACIFLGDEGKKAMKEHESTGMTISFGRIYQQGSMHYLPYTILFHDRNSANEGEKYRMKVFKRYWDTPVQLVRKN